MPCGRFMPGRAAGWSHRHDFFRHGGPRKTARGRSGTSDMKRTLVILTFNEIEGLRALWSAIPFGAADEVLAIDPGSTDGTLEFLREKGIRVLPQEKHGRGEAFRIGAREALGEVLCFFSPDGN